MPIGFRRECSGKGQISEMHKSQITQMKNSRIASLKKVLVLILLNLSIF